MNLFFILLLLAIKTAGSAQKLRVGRVSGNTAIFVYTLLVLCTHFCISRSISLLKLFEVKRCIQIFM